MATPIPFFTTIASSVTGELIHRVLSVVVADGRQLAAIMFTDIAGFTRLTQADEAGALELLRDQDRIVGPIVTAHRGRRIKSMGDGLLIVFPNALDAVECGVAIQRALRQRNSGSPGAPLRVRIGIHLGDIELRGGDVLGDAVNIASRVEPLAEPGEVCVSDPVYAQVHNKVAFQFVTAGPRFLEGVQDPVTIYRITEPGSSAPAMAAGAPLGRIAVLPFANMSPNPEDSFLADGITEELIGRLSGVAGARVIARTSVMHYKDSRKRVDEVGRELGVGLIVEGSVRRSGNRLRLTAQLLDARSEEHLWASQFDRELRDIFDIQTEIATKVAKAIEGRLAASGARQPRSVTAYTTYLRALQLLHTEDAQNARDAIRLFGEVITEDPEYPYAHTGLAQAWISRALQGVEEWSVLRDRAEPAARRALELAPDLDEPHAVMADLHGLSDRHEDAIAEAQRAIELNPNASTAYRSLGIDLGAVGRLPESYAAMTRAVELDPLAGRTAVGLAELSQALGHTEEAERLLIRMHGLYPNVPRVTFELTMHYVRRGDYGQATRIVEEALRSAPSDAVLLSAQSIVWGFQGRRDLVEPRSEELRARGSRQLWRFTELVTRTALGDLDLAFRALDWLADEHSWPWLVASASWYAPLRADPRFAAFCRRVRIPLPTPST